MKTLFFLGKGGVGKSTCAAVTALGLARAGSSVILLSFDPAHNLGDLFERKLGTKPKEIIKGLRVAEIDRGKRLRRYLRDVEQEIRGSYRYLTAFNLEHHFRLFRHAPGLEEHAMLLAFEDARETFRDTDYLVADMPPTASSLKFFAGPALSLLWLEQLLALRRKIFEKRELITKIRFGKREIVTDGVLGRLEASAGRTRELRDFLCDPEACRKLLVINPEKLSEAEARRILAGLSEVDISVQQVLLNRAEEAARGKFEGIPLSSVARIERPPVGLKALEEMLTDFPLSQVAGSVVHWRSGG